MKEILDHEEIELSEGEIKYRPLALLSEGIPFLIGIIGVVFYNEFTVIGFSLLSLIYLIMGWYIFKGATFSLGSIIYGTLSGIILSIAANSVLFGLLDWNYHTEMAIVANTLIIPALVFSIIWYLIRKDKHFEYTLSLKIISRLVFALLLLFLLEYL
jgi:hypothetical protein